MSMQMSSADQRNRMKAATDKYVPWLRPVTIVAETDSSILFRMKGTTDRIAQAQRTVAETEEIGT